MGLRRIWGNLQERIKSGEKPKEQMNFLNGTEIKPEFNVRLKAAEKQFGFIPSSITSITQDLKAMEQRRWELIRDNGTIQSKLDKGNMHHTERHDFRGDIRDNNSEIRMLDFLLEKGK